MTMGLPCDRDGYDLRFRPRDLAGSLLLASAVVSGRDARHLSRSFVMAIYHRWFRDRNLVWC